MSDIYKAAYIEAHERFGEGTYAVTQRYHFELGAVWAVEQHTPTQEQLSTA